MHNLMARKYPRELSFVSKSAVEHRITAESQEENALHINLGATCQSTNLIQVVHLPIAVQMQIYYAQ